MNNRINELFGNALDEAVPETWTTLNVQQLSRLKDKFAELIVRECVQFIDEENVRLCEYQNSLPEGDTNRREDCDLVIEKCLDLVEGLKEHFGVEE